MGIAGFAIFVLGLIFVIVAPINMRKNARCSAQTQGILTRISVRENSKGADTHSYTYSYNVDGIEYQTRSTILSTGTNNIGDACTIWYDPKNPKKAQPFHYESNKVYKIILFVGIGMILLGIILAVIGIGMS